MVELKDQMNEQREQIGGITYKIDRLMDHLMKKEESQSATEGDNI
jgi:uncharacterized small protein (DUF1192 family)